MNVKAFFVDALAAALDVRIATPDDVIRHVTPDVLAQHLPRPLWARVLRACLAAPTVDAALIVDTIGLPNLAEHIPASIIWSCIAEIGVRALGTQLALLAASATPASAVLAPPPDEHPKAAAVPAGPVAIGPSVPARTPQVAANQPLADVITELEDERAREPRNANLRPRSPTGQRFRQSNTSGGRTGLTGRRPMASAAPVPPVPPASIAQGTGTAGRTPRRSGTEEIDLETETAVESGDWSVREVAVDDAQLVDWQADGATSPSAITGDDDFSDLGRKR